MNRLSVSLAVASALSSLSALAEDKPEEIVVTASRIETPLRQIGASVSVIDEAEIELRGYPTVAELLATQPGISLSNSGGLGKQTSLSIRGEQGFRTLVMIDGVEMSDPSGTQVQPQFEHLLAGSDIERIEVLRGPQGFIYGADAGGVVNIITRSVQQGISAGAALELGSFDSRRLSAFGAVGGERADAFVSLARQSTDGFNARAIDATEEEDGYENTTLHAKAGYKVTERLRGQLVLRDISAENEYDGFSGTDLDNIGEFDQSTGKLSVTHEGEQLVQQGAWTVTDIERRFLTAGAVSFETEGQLRKAEYIAHWQAAPWATLVAGGEQETEQVDSGGLSLARDQTGVFSELQTAFAERLYISAGVRFDDNEDFGEHWSGRVSSAYWLEVAEQASVKLRASAGNGFRAPSLNELTWGQLPGVRADLAEETSRGYDLGAEYHRASGLTAQLTYFEQTLEDEIDYDFETDQYQQVIGRAHSRGWELALQAPVNSYLRLDANATIMDTENVSGEQRGRKPGKSANLGVYLTPAEDLTLLIHSRWVSDLMNRDGSGPLPSYRLVDLSVTYAVSEQLQLFARGENLLDEDYQVVSGYNTAERAGYIGARLTF